MDDNIIKVRGLAFQYNPLATTPGALIKANNCMIRRPDIAEDRRGHALYSSMAGATKQALKYSSKTLFHQGSTLSYDNGSGTYTDISGTYDAPTNYKIHGVEAFSNLYFTTSLGVKVKSALSSDAARLAGAPRCLDISYALNAASTGFLATAFQCAYRATILRTDSNNNVITGYPSQRLWVTNSSGNSKNTDLTIYLPSECIATDVIQVYRTSQVSGTSTDASGDETGLVYRYELVSADISAGFITFTDSVTDTLRGETLYTSPSQQGIAQANDRPPVCKDMALHKSKFMCYANVSTKQRLYATLVGTGSLGKQTTGDTHSNTTVDNIASTTNIAIGWKVTGTGIPAGTTVSNIVGTTVTLSQAATATAAGVTLTFVTNKTITLGGTTYSFGDTEITSGAGSPQIAVSVTGTAASDIDITSRSLVRVINRYASNTTVYAYYLTGPTDLPGQFLIEEKGLGASAFTLQSNSSILSGMIFPAPPVSPTTNTKSTSSNSSNPNYIFVSKENQGEHVPVLSFYPVGPANKAILRLAPLRDSTIVIKEEGVYRFAGENAQSFTVTPIDLTVQCKAADSVAVLSNQVFMLSNQGIVAITETGVEVISWDIEPAFTAILASTNLSSNTYGLAYESDRSYFLSTIAQSSDTTANQTWVYNIFTKTWVRHTYAISCGIVEDSADKMYFSKPGDTNIYRERKDFADTDFADPEYSITISSIVGSLVTFTSGSVTPLEGWAISQGGTGLAIKSLVTNASDYTATMDSTPPTAWTTGAASLFPSVGFEIEWNSWTGNMPGEMKQVGEVAVFADDISGNNTANSLHITFRSNFDEDVDEIAITKSAQGWGGNWGVIPWGGGGDSYGYRTYTPKNKQYCARLNVGVRHKYALERLPIAGWSPNFSPVSRRIGK